MSAAPPAPRAALRAEPHAFAFGTEAFERLLNASSGASHRGIHYGNSVAIDALHGHSGATDNASEEGLLAEAMRRSAESALAEEMRRSAESAFGRL